MTASASRRVSALCAAVSVLAATLFTWGWLSPGRASADGAAGGAADGAPAFTRTETISRTHLVDGKDVTVDTRTFSVTVDRTTNLRDREGIAVRWTGAHPTGGVYYDPNAQYADDQEYPVVILQCRGLDSDSAPADQRLSRRTCFTQTPNTRYQPNYQGAFPSYRLDRYATPAERRQIVGAPDPRPAACPSGPAGYAERFVPFDAADGTIYYGGFDGCAGLAPEQARLASPLNPSNATFATTAADGTGSARFVVQDDRTNASLGCSATVACSLVIIPIMGIACDAAAADLPVQDRPADPAAAQRSCALDGFYQPGQPASDQRADDPNAEVPVTGMLWWSESNWRNRISVPITLAVTTASCDITGGGGPENVYGSQYLLQATQQWAPAFCANPDLFTLQHTQTSEVQAKNLLATGVTDGKYLGVKAAFQAAPPEPRFGNPIVQAPTAVTGFAIGYVMDDGRRKRFTDLRLDARLLAKLLTMSYPAYPAVRDGWATEPKYAKYRAASKNPLDLSVDPEFLALNPGMSTPYINQLESSATLFVMSSDSDVMTALTSYIAADPEAAAFMAGKPDPWGMVVNPNYRNLPLPTANWPLLDGYYNSLGNECIADNRTPVLPLIAGQVSDPAQITFNMQFGISNSQVNCTVTGPTNSKDNRRLAALGPQQAGIRFLLGLVSLADARRYQIDTAALQTQSTVPLDRRFTDAGGRSFAAPTPAALLAAARMLRPDDAAGTWPVPYDRLRTEAAGRAAYPGTLLISTDVPTAGLEQDDARKLAKFLDFVAGPGQVSGTQNGQLPDGYLPITAANGLGALVDYTKAAARAVAAQKGVVPVPSGRTAAASSPPPAVDPTSVPPPPADPAPIAGGGAPEGAGGAAGGTATPPRTTAAPGPTASPAVALVPTAATTGIAPGWGGYALPGLALVALASGAVSLWTSGLGRR